MRWAVLGVCCWVNGYHFYYQHRGKLSGTTTIVNSANRNTVTTWPKSHRRRCHRTMTWMGTTRHPYSLVYGFKSYRSLLKASLNCCSSLFENSNYLKIQTNQAPQKKPSWCSLRLRPRRMPRFVQQVRYELWEAPCTCPLSKGQPSSVTPAKTIP